MFWNRKVTAEVATVDTQRARFTEVLDYEFDCTVKCRETLNALAVQAAVNGNVTHGRMRNEIDKLIRDIYNNRARHNFATLLQLVGLSQETYKRFQIRMETLASSWEKNNELISKDKLFEIACSAFEIMYTDGRVFYDALN